MSTKSNVCLDTWQDEKLWPALRKSKTGRGSAQSGTKEESFNYNKQKLNILKNRIISCTLNAIRKKLKSDHCKIFASWVIFCTSMFLAIFVGQLLQLKTRPDLIYISQSSRNKSLSWFSVARERWLPNWKVRNGETRYCKW